MEIVRRIYAIDARLAAAEARDLASLFDRAFTTMTVQSDLPMEEAVVLARRWLREQMAADEWLLAATSPADAEGSRFLRGRNAAKVSVMREQLANNDLSQAALIVAGIERQESLNLSPEGRDRLARLILRGMVAVQETYADRLQGLYRAPSDPIFADAIETIEKPAPTRPEPTVAVTPAPIFTDIVERLIASKLASRSWDEKSERQARDTFALFVEHADDRSVSSYRREEISGFLDVVRRLPRLRGKSPALTGLPLFQLVAAVDAGAEAIGPKSIKRHMSIMSLLFAWTIDQGWRLDNPADKVFRLNRTKAANEERVPWTDDQIVTLFGLPIWQGRKKPTSRIESGEIVLRDAWWWWPIIGLHTGARLGEIAQLGPQDIGEEGGLYFFDIGRSGGRKVKTHASARRVPLHRTLVELGLVERRDRMKAEGRLTMWPEMPPARYGDQQGGAFTRSFGEMLRHFGIAGPTFHSFRHVVYSQLENLGHATPKISAIAGHVGGGMSSRYGGRLKLDVLAEAINQLVYPKVDFLALPAETKA